MERYINVDGKKMKMVANARAPRVYRNKFGTDLILDMQKLTEGYKKAMTGENFPVELLTIFENVAWIFLKEGGENVGDNPDEWLASVNGLFSIYEIFPEIVKLWNLNNMTTSTPRNGGRKTNNART